MQATHESPPVVVGVDGSTGSKAALRFAIAEGLARHATVRIVTTWLLGPPMTEAVTDDAFAAQEAATRALQEATIAEVGAEFDELPELDPLVVHDVGGATLIDSAQDAAMLVVGSGHKGALARAFLGSVSEFCVRHSRVPVVVVPDPARAD